MHLVPDLGPRYVGGRRIHHGLVGAVLTFVGVVAGGILMWDDRHDWPWRLRDRPRRH